MNGIANLGKLPYKIISINTSELLIPRDQYQRNLEIGRVREIAANFDEYIANEPKVSARGGKYYVFDGQHTIAARKMLNGGKDLPVFCKVYFDLSQEDEAILFAQQTGFAAKVYPGAKVRALVFAGDPKAVAFMEATESAGMKLSFNQTRGQNRIGCVSAAYAEFLAVGTEIYTEALRVIAAAWGGHKDSLRSETIIGVTEFVKLYHDEYDPRRLVSRCHRCDPMYIYRRVKAAGDSLPAPQKYVLEVWNIYNGTGKQNNLPLRF